VGAQRKIKSGIYGLNSMLDGGLNEHSSTVVIGASGAGKTTVATQFCAADSPRGRRDLHHARRAARADHQRGGADGLRGHPGAIEEESIIFIDASGKQFREFILKELQDLSRRGAPPTRGS